MFKLLNSRTYRWVLLGIIAIQVFCLSEAFAANSKPVTVTDTASNPVPVSVQGAVSASVVPYQHEAAIADSSSCAPQCHFTFPTIPEGQRLVITHISAQLGPTVDTLLLEGNGTTLFVPKANSSVSDLGAQVTYYVEPGSAPAARVFQPNSAEHTSLIIDIVGHLVPAQ